MEHICARVFGEVSAVVNALLGVLLGLASVWVGMFLHEFNGGAKSHIVMYGYFALVNGVCGGVFGYFYRRQRELSTKDPLTGLYNRRFLSKVFARLVREATRRKSPVSLILLDLDDFKAINDSKGHVAADAILRDFAQCLQKSLRGSDVVSRYGGDEFVLILPNTSADGAKQLMKRLRTEVMQTCGIRISLGIATNSKSKSSFEELLRDADTMMYREKQSSLAQA